MTTANSRTYRIEGKNNRGWFPCAKYLGRVFTWAEAEAEITNTINALPALGKAAAAYRIVEAA